MATNKSNYDYEEISAHFGKEKVMERYNALEENIGYFIERSNFKKNVLVSYSLLNQAVIDYFADIYRLKVFHHIDKT